MKSHSRLLSVLLILSAALTACVASRSNPGPVVRHTLAPTGVLRVALYTGTPTSLVASTDLRGVGYDLGREMARNLGVPFRPIVFAKNTEVLEAIKSERADIAFTNASSERAREMNFTQPYLTMELGYLATATTSVAALNDVDRPGVRVGVTAKSSTDVSLSRDLKYALVVRSDTLQAGIQMLEAATVDVYATNKATLYEMADKLPGSRLLTGSWGNENHALAVPKGREEGLPFAKHFIAHAIASGQVQAAITRAGLRGATVSSETISQTR